MTCKYFFYLYLFQMDKESKRKFVKKIDDMIFYEDSLTEEEKELYQNLFSYTYEMDVKTFIYSAKRALIKDYVHNISVWVDNLKEFESKEEYEICAKIMRVILIEEREFLKMFLATKCDSDAQKVYYTKLISEVKELANKHIK